MVETMRPKGAVSSNRVFFRKAFLGKQVDGGTGQSSPAQGSPAPGVGKPCEAISFRQTGEGDQIVNRRVIRHLAWLSIFLLHLLWCDPRQVTQPL